MNSLRTLVRFGRQSPWAVRTVSRRTNSTEAAAVSADKLSMPPPDGLDRPANPKLSKIAEDISALNLLEVSELSSLLKKKLNLPETSFMPAMGMAMPAASSAEEDEDAAAPKKVQTSFKVKMVKFDEKQKVALIKEIKGLMEGMNLVQAKKFVESAPTLVKDDVSKEEAEKLKEALSKVGAIIEIE